MPVSGQIGRQRGGVGPRREGEGWARWGAACPNAGTSVPAGATSAACRDLYVPLFRPALTSPNLCPPPRPPAAYRYRSLTPGADADAPGFQLQCDRSFLTGKAAKAGLVRISSAPAYTRVSPANSKLALILALAAQPAVTTLAVDASFQHYAGGIWSSPSCAAGELSGA